ncbi:MAG TPA: PASTA domain-containing protein [Prolixibacteraceae bacterium]|jgi:beta-lactam-binding protein with PASTA domain
MRLKEFFTSKIFLKNFGIAVLLTIVLIWFTMAMLSFYTNKGENISTPDLKGLNINEVKSVIDKNDLRLVIEDTIYRKEVQPGTVVLQNPSAGHKIKPNRIIYVTLASATPEQVEVPKLTDVSMRQARVLLESKGFAMGNIEMRPSEFNDLVLEQKHNGLIIQPGSRLDNGSTIDLVVGKNMAGGETIIPDLTSMSLTAAKDTLKSRSLTPGSLIYDPSIRTTEDTLNAIIWKQMPMPDSTKRVMSGISVDLWLKLKVDTTNTEINTNR